MPRLIESSTALHYTTLHYTTRHRLISTQQYSTRLVAARLASTMSPFDVNNLSSRMPATLAPRWVTPSQTPFIDTTVWTLTSVAVIFLALRLWTRIRANRTLFADDWLLIAATVRRCSLCWDVPARATLLTFCFRAYQVLLLGHAPLICWYTRVLFDVDIDLRLYSYLAETNVLLYSLTQALSKASIAVVLTRCTFGYWKWTTWALTGLVCAMLVPHAIMGFAIICDQNPLYAQWAIPGPCIEYPKLKMFKISIQGTSRVSCGDAYLTLFCSCHV